MVCVISRLFIPFSLTGFLLKFLRMRIIFIIAQIIYRRVRHRLIDNPYSNYCRGQILTGFLPPWGQIEAGDSENEGFCLSLALFATDFGGWGQGFSRLTMEDICGVMDHLFHTEQEI
jgi:hypothetical protein